MDLGKAISMPLQDKEWVKKCLIMGLWALVPIAGVFNLMGWMKKYYQGLKAGDTTLPPPGFNYLGDGWATFLAILPMVGIIIVVNIAISLVTWVLAKVSPGLASVVGLVLTLGGALVGLVLGLLAPAMLHRHLAHGDTAPAFAITKLLDLVKANVGAYLMLVVAGIVAQIIGNLGMIACGVGLLVTLPLSMAIQGAAFFEYGKIANDAP